MKLLSGPQGKSQHQIQGAAQELRLLELDQMIADKRRELVVLDREIMSHPGLAGFEAEEAALREKARVLSEKVENLERRHALALVPLEAREKEIDTKSEALLQREETLAIKETDVAETAELLEEKLDSVSEREQNSVLFSAELEARNSNLSIKEEDMAKRQDALIELMKEFHRERLQSEAAIARQQAVLKGRDTALTERERVVSKKEKGFASREKAIVDRYQTLERAIAEMKLKYGDKLIFKDTDARTRNDNQRPEQNP